jgi:hypothetical protein
MFASIRQRDHTRRVVTPSPVRFFEPLQAAQGKVIVLFARQCAVPR